jgi:mono/diheme cytochrome c family protein
MRESLFRKLYVLPVALVTLAACPAADDVETGGEGTGSTSEASTSEASTSGVDSSGGESSTGDAPAISGEEFFLSVCAPCHGSDGEGTALGYEIQHPVRDYSSWVVRNGRPPGNAELPGSVMTAYATGSLEDATLEEIWDYLDTLPQPTTGEALYMDYCRNCHGTDAAGGITGVDIRLELLEIFEQVREGENVGNYAARSTSMPAFDESRISDAEIQLIADYVAGL